MDALRSAVGPQSSSHARTLARRRFLALGLLTGAAALAACSQPPAPTASPAAPPAATAKPAAGATAVTAANPTTPARRLAAELIVGTSSLNDTPDPHGTLSVSGFSAARPVYDTLVTFDGRDGKIVPQLAASWQRVDNNTMELKLRDDVKFQNGEPFTADTVKFNVERIVNATEPLYASTKSRMGPLVGAEVVNSTTVRIKTKSPDPILLNRLTMLFMVPPKYTAEGGDLKTKPVGTGPYRTVEWITNQRQVLEAWDGSWRGKPTMQKVTLQNIPEPATALAAIRRGEIDILSSVPADQVDAIKRDGFSVSTSPSGSCLLCSLLPSHPLTRDKRVREAFNLAVNKEEMLQTVQAGLGRVAQGQFLQPGMFGYQEDVKAIPYDPERAQALLTDAGVLGQEVLITTAPTTKPYADAVAGYLTAVGMRGRSDVIDFATLASALSKPWDRPMIQWSSDFFQFRDIDAVYPRFTKDFPAPHFDNDETTRLFRAAQTELDEQKRANLIRQIVQITRDEFGALWLIWRDLPTVFSKKIPSVTRAYDGSYPYWTIEKEA